MAYRAPVEDIAFILQSVVPLAPVAATERFAEATPDTVAAILSEAGRMATEVLAPLNRNGDLAPARLENGAVRSSPGFDRGMTALAEGGWVGLSEITLHGDFAYLIERDNQLADKAAVKRLYRVALADLTPGDLGGPLPVVKKALVRDLLPDLAASKGYVLDKVEGFAIDAAGEGFVVTDNDGVDDSSGETLFWSIGKVE